MIQDLLLTMQQTHYVALAKLFNIYQSWFSQWKNFPSLLKILSMYHNISTKIQEEQNLVPAFKGLTIW